MKMDNQFEKEFNSLKEDYSDFLDEVIYRIRKSLSRSGIPIAFEVKGRIKSLVSIREKILSGTVKVEKSIFEINDIIGLRVVVLFPEFKEDVRKLLANEFRLINDSTKESTPNTFGYSSIHLILGIKNSWKKFSEWEKHLEKKFELQIRTVSEHIYAETSHLLFYKRETNVPNYIQRDFSRLSALLDIVDEKLIGLKKGLSEYYTHVKTCSYKEVLSLDLNPETFRRVMKKHSNDIYDLDDNENNVLSSTIEKKYNITIAKYLNDVIEGKIQLEGLTSELFIESVLQILEENNSLYGIESNKEIAMKKY